MEERKEAATSGARKKDVTNVAFKVKIAALPCPGKKLFLWVTILQFALKMKVDNLANVRCYFSPHAKIQLAGRTGGFCWLIWSADWFVRSAGIKLSRSLVHLEERGLITLSGVPFFQFQRFCSDVVPVVYKYRNWL